MQIGHSRRGPLWVLLPVAIREVLKSRPVSTSAWNMRVIISFPYNLSLIEVRLSLSQVSLSLWTDEDIDHINRLRTYSIKIGSGIPRQLVTHRGILEMTIINKLVMLLFI